MNEDYRPDDKVQALTSDAGREGETLAAQVRNYLVDAITGGNLAPGSEIDEQVLAQRFGASRTPVREALRELASAGLVIIQPRRGARVMEMTVDRIGELFELMAEIEAVCARFATHRITAHERGILSHIHAASMPFAHAGDVDGYDKLNLEFHEVIYRATHNRELQNHARTLRQRGAPFRRAQFRGVLRLKASWTEHDGILQEIFAGDGDGGCPADARAHAESRHGVRRLCAGTYGGGTGKLSTCFTRTMTPCQ